MKKIAEFTSLIFGLGVYLCLFAGGLAAVGYLVALILGGGEGGTGYQLARFIQRTYFPYVFQLASASVMIGLLSMYLSGQKALTIVTDKQAADKEIAQSKN